MPFEQLLAESDFVSVHAPLTPETRHLIGARELRLMKPSAFIVNTARGAIIDEIAPVEALAERRIAGAGLFGARVAERNQHNGQARLRQGSGTGLRRVGKPFRLSQRLCKYASRLGGRCAWSVMAKAGALDNRSA